MEFYFSRYSTTPKYTSPSIRSVLCYFSFFKKIKKPSKVCSSNNQGKAFRKKTAMHDHWEFDIKEKKNREMFKKVKRLTHVTFPSFQTMLVDLPEIVLVCRIY